MNLGEILSDIGDELVHFPDVKAIRDNRRKLVNRIYLSLMNSANWRFRQREYKLKLFTDVSVTVASVTTQSVQRFRATLPTGYLLSDVEQLPGHECRVVDPDATDTVDGPEVTFIIERAEIVASALDLYLDPRFTSPSPGAFNAATTIDIQFRRYLLPRDCADVMYVMSRDDDVGPMSRMSVATEHDIMMNDDVDGDPRFYLAADNLTGRQQGSSYSARQVNHNWRSTSNRPPNPDYPFAAADGGIMAPGLQAGTYEYKYCWVHSGRISPPSNVISITVVDTHEVDLSGMEDITAPVDIGREKLVFRRKDEGPWRLVTTISATATTHTDGARELPATGNPLDDTRYRELSNANYDYMRVWPRPNADKTIHIHYQAKVPALEYDGDTPEMPEEFHSVLVHMAVAQLAARFSNGALKKTHDRIAEDLTSQLKARYLDRDDQVWQRRALGTSHLRQFIQPDIVFDNS